MTVILAICFISLLGVSIYYNVKEMNGDGHTPNVIEVPKKAEPSIKISINLYYDKNKTLEEIRYQVPLSHAAFYIPSFKDTIVYNKSNFIVKEVKRDFNSNNVIITAYKTS